MYLRGGQVRSAATIVAVPAGPDRRCPVESVDHSMSARRPRHRRPDQDRRCRRRRWITVSTPVVPWNVCADGDGPRRPTGSARRCFDMRTRLRAAALAAVVPMAFATAAAGQTALRTPDGQPDLQGVWDFRTMTPAAAAGGSGTGLPHRGGGGRCRGGRRRAPRGPASSRARCGPNRSRRAAPAPNAAAGWVATTTSGSTTAPTSIEDRRTSLVIGSARRPAAAADARGRGACARSVRSPRICRSNVPSASGAPAPAPTTRRTAVWPSAVWSASTAVRR